MLTSKQRAYLTGLSNSLDPIIQVGQQGVTPEVVRSAEEAFNTHELIKGSVQKNVLMDVRSCAEMVAERSRAELVTVIGRKFILYKPFREKPVITLPKKKA
ncbi:MAG: YhbY family RNA-binding protein [Eubacteriales bacterium]|nr:YhbY family RNA-binding protein [Eubacteriales bacterium]